MQTTITIDEYLKPGWSVRLANCIIDIIMVYVIIFILFIVAALVWDGFGSWVAQESEGILNVIGVVIMMLYYIVMELTVQKTIGKYITGTMVVMEDATKPEPRAIVIRNLCRLLPFEMFSFLKAYPRGWHDSASGTYVVRTKQFNEALNLKESFSEIGTFKES